MKTCTVTARVFVGKSTEYGKEPDEVRVWKNVDIMKVSHTRGWCTRQFNMHWDWRKRDMPIRVEWECRYDDGSQRFTGCLSGVNSTKVRRGIFE